MAELPLYVRVGEQKLYVEVSSTASVGDVVAAVASQLAAAGGTLPQGVALSFQGRTLAREELLADIGVGAQATLDAETGRRWRFVRYDAEQKLLDGLRYIEPGDPPVYSSDTIGMDCGKVAIDVEDAQWFEVRGPGGETSMGCNCEAELDPPVQHGHLPVSVRLNFHKDVDAYHYVYVRQQDKRGPGVGVRVRKQGVQNVTVTAGEISARGPDGATYAHKRLPEWGDCALVLGVYIYDRGYRVTIEQ
eukprot:TRINITY_DN45532_c0_g1_i1.p1 TRINITY_DN45532_c0_g1~~TRINITY_DN45532_c0_g1_i1.p1  ORF type:complete len:271 (+),score=52.71 TRINITY_DN45532_c0_g1_i1:75-815(+)